MAASFSAIIGRCAGMASENDKLGFFFPVYGFEHQRYIENRIRLFQDREFHVVALMQEPNSRWSIPAEKVTILSSRNFIVRGLNRACKTVRGITLSLRGISGYRLIAPIGWKRGLARAARKQGIGAFLVFYGGSAILAGNEFRRLGIPYSVMIEGSDPQMAAENAWYERRLSEVWREAERCVFVSKFLRDQALAMGCPAGKCEVAYNGTTIPSRKPPWSFDRPIRLVSIGNLLPVKGHAYLLDGFRLALERENRMRLTIVGGGYLERELRDAARGMGIEDKVDFTGAIPWGEAQEVLRRSHIFLSASVRTAEGEEEGLPLAAIEAQAAGKPAIVSASGGLPEVVEDGVTGLVVPPRDPRAIGLAILRLVADPARLASMSDRAYERAARLFDIRGQVALLKGICDSMLP